MCELENSFRSQPREWEHTSFTSFPCTKYQNVPFPEQELTRLMSQPCHLSSSQLTLRNWKL